MSETFCKRPFEEIEIGINGDVYTCCPNWNKYYAIGNIGQNSFEEIWNSEKAVDVRTRILNNDYSLCDYDNCSYLKQKNFVSDFNTDCTPIMLEHPKIVKFVYDYECNIACKMCRNKVNRMTQEELEILNSKIDTFFLPILQGAKVLIINSAGDPFGSRHSRLVIKKAAAKYPELKFDFHTNGIFCNENNFKELNITPEKIAKIRMSFHATTAKTYGKIVPNGEIFFPKIIKNLRELAELKKTYEFPIYIHFVVTSLNYTEIPDFIKLALELNVQPRFWEVRQENCSYTIADNLYVVKSNHPLHKDLLRVLNNPLVIQYKNEFSPALYDLIESVSSKAT